MSRRRGPPKKRRQGPGPRTGGPSPRVLWTTGAAVVLLLGVAVGIACSGGTEPIPVEPPEVVQPPPRPATPTRHDPDVPPPADDDTGRPPAPPPLFSEASVTPVGPTEQVHVERVVDGDTLKLSDGRKIRLIGINTPEHDRPLYGEATNTLRELVDGQDITIELDELPHDKFGRTLAYIFRGDLFVNGEIVRRGMAYAFLWPQNRVHAEPLLEYQREARQKGVGLWALEQPPPCDEYIGNVNAPYFHRPGCERLKHMRARDRRVFKTREEAFEAGMNPCFDCKS